MRGIGRKDSDECSCDSYHKKYSANDDICYVRYTCENVSCENGTEA